jgi:hypothetical protein
MSDEERPRKSWREIDKGRDRSAHRREERPPQEGRKRGPGSQKSYRAALDRLFTSGKIGELVAERAPGALPGADADDADRLKLAQRVRGATGRDEITRELDAYLAKHPLPDELDLLEKALEHRSPALQLEAMGRIDGLLDAGQAPRRKRGMVGQLKMIRDLGEDAELTALASRLIARLE